MTALGVTGRAPSIESRSIAEFIVTTSTRSTLRPWTSAPAAAAPSAMPFISSRNSGSKRRSMSASASVRRPLQPWAGSLASRRIDELLDVGDDLVGDQLPELAAAGVGRALHVDEDPAAVLVAEGRPLPADALEGDDLGDVADLGERDVVEPGAAGGRPVAAEVERTRSAAAVATNVVSTRVQSLVPPTAGEWFVNGNEAIESVAGTAVG